MIVVWYNTISFFMLVCRMTNHPRNNGRGVVPEDRGNSGTEKNARRSQYSLLLKWWGRGDKIKGRCVIISAINDMNLCFKRSLIIPQEGPKDFFRCIEVTYMSFLVFHIYHSSSFTNPGFGITHVKIDRLTNQGS
jgi:hypothetical protein